jgi:hypothetical protein
MESDSYTGRSYKMKIIGFTIAEDSIAYRWEANIGTTSDFNSWQVNQARRPNVFDVSKED